MVGQLITGTVVDPASALGVTNYTTPPMAPAPAAAQPAAPASALPTLTPQQSAAQQLGLSQPDPRAGSDSILAQIVQTLDAQAKAGNSATPSNVPPDSMGGVRSRLRASMSASGQQLLDAALPGAQPATAGPGSVTTPPMAPAPGAGSVTTPNMAPAPGASNLSPATPLASATLPWSPTFTPVDSDPFASARTPGSLYA